MKTETLPSQQLQKQVRISLLCACIGIVGLLFSVVASAQSVQPGMGMFDDIAAFYMQQAKAMQAVLEPFALRLFALLAVLSIAAFFVKQVLSDEASVGSLVTRFTMEIMKLGFFLYIVTNGPQLLLQLIGLFIQSGAAVTGQGELSPSEIVILGFDACFRTFDAIGAMGWGDTAAFGLPLALAGMGILACFSIVGILYLVRVIELYLVMYGGVILLGFGGISFTRDIPKNYLSYMLSAGAQLFMLNVVIGLGLSLVESWPATLTLDTTPDAVLRQVLQLFVGSAVFAALSWSIPKVAASLVNGAVSLGASDAFAPAAAAAAAVSRGAIVATGGASGLVAATRGAVQATTAGASLAKEQGSSGLGAALKGFGHAAGATAEEARRAAEASLGIKPPSPNSTDSRGRQVDNLGTRAANSLREKVMQTREERAAKGESDEGASESAPPSDREPTSHKNQTVASGGFDGRTQVASGRRLVPPTLPPDTPPPSNVSIRFDSDE